MKDKMWKYFTANSTRVYIDVLDKLVQHYNNTKHGSINTLPAKDGDLRLSASNACLPKTEISVFVMECVFHIHTLQTTYVHIA